MKVYIVNKNIEHSGVKYAKGAIIKPGDIGFEEITSKGHADMHEPQAVVEPKAEPAIAEKPARKPGK